VYNTVALKYILLVKRSCTCLAFLLHVFRKHSSVSSFSMAIAMKRSTVGLIVIMCPLLSQSVCRLRRQYIVAKWLNLASCMISLTSKFDGFFRTAG